MRRGEVIRLFEPDLDIQPGLPAKGFHGQVGMNPERLAGGFEQFQQGGPRLENLGEGRGPGKRHDVFPITVKIRPRASSPEIDYVSKR
jgi:hypothetical protein